MADEPSGAALDGLRSSSGQHLPDEREPTEATTDCQRDCADPVAGEARVAQNEGDQKPTHGSGGLPYRAVRAMVIAHAVTGRRRVTLSQPASPFVGFSGTRHWPCRISCLDKASGAG